ncbi:MAG: DUF488 domain-containing protein [Methanobrevibacter sp.]|nr:DUF488 domain-containing protein [Methanobrevibacter sp.]
MNTIYTIGHSSHKIDYFIKLLKKFDINLVLDVRSTPYSKYAPQFNKELFEKELETNGINYNFVGHTFGARQKDSNLYSEDGILDFDKVKESNKFKIGITKVINNVNIANIVLMCSEKEPIDCHRSILISNVFSKRNISIKHILANGEIETQRSLENRLLALYGFPGESQKTLHFFDKNKDNKHLNHLKKAYEKRNKDIGHSIISK